MTLQEYATLQISKMHLYSQNTEMHIKQYTK